MMFLRNFQKLQNSSNIVTRESSKLFALSRTICDKPPDKEIVAVNRDTDLDLAPVKRNTKDCAVKAEEKKIIAAIHADYKKDVLVKAKTSDDKDKYVVRFDTRLDHFRRSGYLMKPTMINVTPQSGNPEAVDKMIDVVMGNSERDLAPVEIFTENSDNRSIEDYPPSR